MRQTLLEIQKILDDIRSDTVVLKLTPLTNKVERVLQFLEGAIRELELERQERWFRDETK